MGTGDYAVQVDPTGLGWSFSTVARFETLAAAIQHATYLGGRKRRWLIEIWDDARGAVAWRP